MTVGERIRAVRKKQALTQKELGEKCGIAEPTIRRYELGKLNPKIETITKISCALDAPLALLMGEQPFPDPFLEDDRIMDTVCTAINQKLYIDASKVSFVEKTRIIEGTVAEIDYTYSEQSNISVHVVFKAYQVLYPQEISLPVVNSEKTIERLRIIEDIFSKALNRPARPIPDVEHNDDLENNPEDDISQKINQLSPTKRKLFFDILQFVFEDVLDNDPNNAASED